MNGTSNSMSRFGQGFVLRAFLLFLSFFVASPLPQAFAAAPAKTESLNDLYEKVKKEGGKLTLYVALSGRSAEVIFPAFKKRFPAVTIDHIDATADALVARAMTEARGGRVIADVFGGALPFIAQMTDQKLLAPLAIPEAAAYPAYLKTEYWVGTDAQFFIIGWNTNLMKKGEEPRGFRILRTPDGRTL